LKKEKVKPATELAVAGISFLRSRRRDDFGQYFLEVVMVAERIEIVLVLDCDVAICIVEIAAASV
jgi:hypothetical protein